MARPDRAILVAALTALLGACSLAPKYEVPQVPVADQYKQVGPWAPAQPADALPRDGWWHAYGYSRLDELQTKLAVNNADLAAALAHYQQADAFRKEVRSGLFPTINPSSVPSPGTAVNASERPVAEGTKGPSGKTPNLQQYTLNLTERARQGRLDPVLGRDFGRTDETTASAAVPNSMPLRRPAASAVPKPRPTSTMWRRIASGSNPANPGPHI